MNIFTEHCMQDHEIIGSLEHNKISVRGTASLLLQSSVINNVGAFKSPH